MTEFSSASYYSCQAHSTVFTNTLSKFFEKSAQKWLIFPSKANDAKCLFQRLQRIKLGNFGNCKSISEGLWEFRIHHKSGIKIYYARVGQRLILIIGGGDKRSQERDIVKAKKYLEDYKRKIA